MVTSSTRHKICSYLSYVLLIILTSSILHAQSKPLPVSVSCRKSFWGKSYVLQVQNLSNTELTIWLQAKGKTASFDIAPGKVKDIGWAQDFSFDANNHFALWAVGYDTLRQVMPSTELAPWRITFTHDRGLALSLSKSFVQEQLSKNMGLPIKERASNLFEVSLNNPPQIDLREGSERVYAEAILQASTFSGKLRFPILTKVSFLPSYSPSTRQLVASQIVVDKIDVKFLPAEWTEVATEFLNRIIPVIFSKVVIYQLDKKEQKYARFLHVRDVRVNDGRLEVLIF
jgi:hypothetical protein